MTAAAEEERYRALVQAAEQQLGERHPVVAYRLVRLADLYSSDWDWHEEAEQLYKRAIGIWEQQSPHHPHMVSPLVNVGNLYLVQGRYDQAIPLFERVILLQKDQRAEADERIIVLEYLAWVYTRQGRQEEVDMLLEVAALLGEQLGVPQRGSTVTLCPVLFNFSFDEQYYEEAMVLLEEKLASEHVLPDIYAALEPKYIPLSICSKRGELAGYDH